MFLHEAESVCLFEDMRAVADGLENSDFDMEWSRSDAVG
jgi:hypothetical protein